MASDNVVYDNFTGSLASLDGKLIGAALMTAAYVPALSDTVIASLTGEASGTGYARQTFHCTYNGATHVAEIADADKWPVFNTSALAVPHNRVVFYLAESGDPDEGKVISNIAYGEQSPTSTWQLEPLAGFARPIRFTALPDASTGAEGDAILADGLGGYVLGPVDSGAPSFVWDPGAIYPGANRFSDWDLFTAAIAAAPYGRKQIVFAADVTIPAGDFDVNGGSLVGGVPGMTTLTFANGAHLVNWPRNGDPTAYYSLHLHSVSSSPVLSMTTSGEPIFDAEVRLTNAGTAPIIDFAGTAGMLQLVTLRNSQFLKLADLGMGGTDHEIVGVSGTPSFAGVACASGNNIIRSDTLRGTSGMYAIVNTAASDVSPTQTNLPGGTVGVQVNTSASALGYTPATSGDWAGSPATAAAAIDRLASAYAALASTPVP